MKKLENIEKILISIDMINGFVNIGPMHDEYIRNLIPLHTKLMSEYDENEKYLNVIVRDTHKLNCREFKFYPVHCVENTDEPKLISELARFENDNSVVFKKNSTSAIHAEGFTSFIDSLTNLKEVTIIGCCTDICVLNIAIPLQNYFDQKDRDVIISIPKDGVETYDAPNHPRDEYNEIAFKLMSQAGIILK